MLFDYWNANSLNFISRKKQMQKLISSIPNKPETFNEKIRFRMAYDRSPILQKFADKYGVRDFVEKTVGKQYLANVYDVSDHPSHINWQSLPENFVCKTNHGSGGMIGVWNGVELEAKLPQDLRGLDWSRWWVHPQNFDSEVCKNMIAIWMRQNYAFRSSAFPEWAYSKINRKVYIEELLLNPDRTIASPYYFFVFRGQTKVVLISSRDKQSRRSLGFTDSLWQKLAVGINSIEPEKDINPFPPKPDNFEEMLSVAEALSQGIDFARVDLYRIGGRIVFSEITNYPGAGKTPWVPEEFEYTMGQYWNLDA